MKRILSLLLTAVMLTGVLAGCKPDDVKTSVKLDPASFETDREMILVADLPPNPFESDAVQLYKEMGFNTFILTEDDTGMIEDGTLKEDYKKAIELLTEAGLEVWIRNMYNDPDYFQLDEKKTGSNYGWPYTLQPRNITTEFSEYPAVTGFYMMDEPFMTTKEDIPQTDDREDLHPAMDQLGKLIEWKNTYYPDAYWHINHVSNTSWDHWPSGQTYGDFIDYYVENVIKKLESGGRSICMDRYPLKSPGGTIDDDFLYSVLTVANATRDYNATAAEGQEATMGICLQTNMDTNLNLRDITSAADVTWQMYTAMAAGAGLFEYFAYRSFESQGISGIVDSQGNKRIYDEVLEANEKALPFQKVTLAFNWKGMTVNHGSESGVEDIFSNVKDLTITDTGVLTRIDSRYDAIVGCFEKDGQDGYMAVNYTPPDLDQTNMITMTFAGCTQALLYTESGWSEVTLAEGGVYRATLDAGEAIFIIPA